MNAAVVAQPQQRCKLERLCRYVARPPLALERLSVTHEGKLRYALKRLYSNGTTHFLFEPLDFIARLAALVPKPRLNPVAYHGVFAPNSYLIQNCSHLPHTSSAQTSAKAENSCTPLSVGNFQHRPVSC